MSESTPALITYPARLRRACSLLHGGACAGLSALLLVAGCGDREIDVRLEGEGVPFGDIDQWKDLPLGAGLSSRISVVRVQWGPRGGAPAFLAYTDDQLSFSAKGGALAPCDGGTCVTATSDEITISADTPDGAATRNWPVAGDLRLSAFTPGSTRETVNALHVRSGHRDRPPAGICFGFSWRGVRACRSRCDGRDHARVIDGDCERHRQRDHPRPSLPMYRRYGFSP